MSKKAALHNLGCKVNAYETEAMQQILERAGYEIVSFQEKADVYVINTCSVTNVADRKSRQMLHRAKKENPGSIVVAAGCYVQTSEKQAAGDLSVDLIIGNNRKHELAEILARYERERSVESKVSPPRFRSAESGVSPPHFRSAESFVGDINCTGEIYEEMPLEKTAEHTRAFLKVQDGCNQFCSYCIIPYARGRVRSRHAEAVVKEMTALAENGCHEVVLTGIHLSSYGIDHGDNLLHLIRQAHQVEGIERIRLGSLEPGIVTEEFVSAIAELPKVCPHFHLSLQSGSDDTLRRMNRKYDTGGYEEKCRLLRKYYQHPAITTDVIVGFPGETEAEFARTEAFLTKIQFYEMHIFKYSKREGTKAAAMGDQVPEEIKNSRSAKLIELGRKMSEEYREYYVGKEIQALLEEKLEYQGKNYYQGYTREYLKVAVETAENMENRFVRGRIMGRLKGEVYLMVEF